MPQRTALYPLHLEAHGRMVDFAGWEMPLHYGSQIDEHHAVRRRAGMFDVSHMTIVDITGAGAGDYLSVILANDVSRADAPGKAIYGCMLNERGGVVDDLIVYCQEAGRYRLVVNAATREKDLAWLRDHARGYALEVSERRDLAMIAVQGPLGREQVHAWLSGHTTLLAAVRALRRFQAAWSEELFVARTGYTGEDGYEVIMPADEASGLWRALAAAGVSPAGLGARDTLRLEAGMNLYGTDMDETTTPLESNLGWTVAWDPAQRAFIGREALEIQRRDGPPRVLVGLVLEGKGVLRGHQPVRCPAGGGETTSGGFSPTLGVGIALARVPAGTRGTVEVEVRDRRLPARVVRPGVARNGRACVEHI